MKRLLKILSATAVTSALTLMPMQDANAFFWGFPFFGGGGGFSFGMGFGGGLGGWGYPGYGWGGYPGYGWGGYPGYGGGYPHYGLGYSGYRPYGWGLPYRHYLPTVAIAPVTAAEK